MNAANLELGLLVNFGETSLKWERITNFKTGKSQIFRIRVAIFMEIINMSTYSIIAETNEATVVSEYIPPARRKRSYQSEAELPEEL